MNRDEFMNELEYLLSDIPDSDKADAIEYYRDYLEEAGKENEDQVIKEFGSPERIAAIIRSEITGNLKEGGEFTENGYQDARFKDPNYQVAKRYDLPEMVDNQPENFQKNEQLKESNRTVKMILWIILLVAASPLILGLGSGLMGIVIGIFGGIFGLAIAIGAITVVFLVLGFTIVMFGIVSMAVHPLGGMLFVGAGILLLGLGLFCLAASGLFYGKFFPFLFRSIVNTISSIVSGRRKRS